MTNYEMMFIIKAGNEGAAVAGASEEVKKIVESNKAKVSEFKDLGLKKLAYPIKKEVNGYYYLINFSANKDVIAEINRKLSINENVLRHLIIKLEGE